MEPRRFILRADHVAEGFAAAGCPPAESSLFAGLPAAAGRLPELIADETGALDPAARLLFETLSASVVSLRFLDFAEGSAIGIETRLVGSAVGNYVAFARPDGEYWDFALLPGRAAALALVDEITGASAHAELDERFALTLNLPALATLVATAQLVRASELAAQLAGGSPSLDFLIEPVPRQYVEAALVQERERPDPASPVSRFAMMCRGVLFDVLDDSKLSTAPADLRDAGLADHGGVLTPEGLALMALLKSRSTLSLLECARRARSGFVVDSLLLLGGNDSLLTGAWRLDGDGKPEALALSAMPARELLALLDRLLKPLPEASPGSVRAAAGGASCCSECGTPRDERQKFCRRCGTKL